MTSSCAIWNDICRVLKPRLGETAYEAWINPIQTRLDEPRRTLILETPNDFIRDWVREHYDLILRDILKNTKHNISLEYRTNPDLAGAAARGLTHPRGAHPPDGPGSAGTETRAARPHERPAGESRIAFPLNPKFTFENFVVGPSNRFTHAACQAIAEAPAKAYNPLFIYGRTGLGKTHLMQAVCHRIQQKNLTTKFYYASSEKFTNDLIAAIQRRSTQALREKLRGVDVLLVDDIHFIANKEATQEEFFHTFNTLYDAHKQIIISSDRPPKEIQKLEERLVSRFSWGLVTDIQPPDLETRVAILKKKTENESAPIPEDVIFFIAEAVKTNIRELEGALVRIIAYSILQERPISLEMAREVLKDLLQEVSRHVSLENIQRTVAEHYRVTAGDLKTDRRGRNIVLPRQVAMYLARELTSLSLPEIGAGFGGKDHTTVLHSCKKIKEALLKDAQLKNIIDRLLTEIKQ